MIYEYYEKYQKTRDIFLPLSEVLKRAEGKTDQFCSIFGYDPIDIVHGPIYAPMYFDIDRAGDLAKAYQDVATVLAILKFYNLTDQDYQVSFSGSKGFHIIVYPEVLNVQPRIDLDKIFKKIARWFSKELGSDTIDFKVYERRRPWRIINTINGKTNLYKIDVDPKKSLEEILLLAKTPQPIPPKFPQKNEVLSGWIQRAVDELNEQPVRRPSVYPTNNLKINSDVQQLIDNGVGMNNRNQTAFYIACYLRAKGFSESETLTYLEAFAAHCSPPYTDYREMTGTLKSAFKGGV